MGQTNFNPKNHHNSRISVSPPGLLRERHAPVPGSLALEVAAVLPGRARRGALRLLWAAVASSPGWQPGAGVARRASGLQWIRARGTGRLGFDLGRRKGMGLIYPLVI